MFAVLVCGLAMTATASFAQEEEQEEIYIPETEDYYAPQAEGDDAEQSHPKLGGDCWRKRYFNIGITKATLTQKDAMVVDDLLGFGLGKPITQDAVYASNMGVSLSIGQTFYLHKPIANILRFGIDATWFDVTYRNYSVLDYDMLDEGYWDDWDEYGGLGHGEGGLTTCKLHEAMIGMQVGPSVTINPIKKLMIEAYFRYCPSLVVQGGTGEGMDVGYGYGSHFVAGCQISWHCIGLGIESKFGSAKMSSIFGDDEDEDDEDYGFFNGDSSSSSGRFKNKTKGWRFFLTFRY